MRFSGGLDDDLITRISDEYSERKLADHENVITLKFGLKSDIRTILREARLARNDLIDDLTLGIEVVIESDEGRENLVEDLHKLVREIAEADRIICVFMHIITREPLPTVQVYQEYVTRVVEWVCDREEE
ncbi:hypothetical protein MYX76_15450 [Desulfobacterota bacterium AH_259_B03_O07]|nr:hypothetical protein [Desulfobacterota bacterium AH_259_B03_O07]